ncbi:cytosine deaminase [Elioraea sp.]|uniref:cytosine deaminase n=1 Tax=Elioraea sp. TaxID=2185103 RepID=UPI0025C701B8|nr:cytosine deaminase [Elioraea sp.]
MWTTIPVAPSYWLRNATLPDGTRADIHIADGMIAALAPAGTGEGGADLRGGMVLPCFTDIHTHLDKGHIWPRSPNPDGTFIGALTAVMGDRERSWSPEDMERRFDFGLRCSFAHGTGAIRTHLDTYLPHGANTWAVFSRLREAWAGRIALEGVSICPIDRFAADEGRAIADLVADHGGIMGFVTRLDGQGDDAIPPGFQDLLDHCFALAEARGLDLDLHVDESGETASATLQLIARTAIRRRFKGRIQVGHICSLALQTPEVIEDTIRLVAEAGISVVSLPMCNMYLQGRLAGRTPRWRGVTLLHELAAAGVPVSVASDNCRDPFYAWGDHDMLEVFREAVRIAHLDTPIAPWHDAVSATPAGLMGHEGTIREGAVADLVLLRARAWHEALARQQSDRIVLRRGRAIDTTLPDYAELDALVAPATSG